MGYSICLAPARSPYGVDWAGPTSPYEARFGVPRFAPACAGRGGRGYAPHWAVSGTQNIALKVLTSSAFRLIHSSAWSVHSRKFAPAIVLWHHDPPSTKGLIRRASMLGKEVPNNARPHRPPDSRCSDGSCSRWVGVGAEPGPYRAAQATQRRCRLHLRSLGRLLRRVAGAHAYRRLGTMERGPGRRF